MVIRELIKHVKTALAEAGISPAAKEAYIIVQHALSCDMNYIIINGNKDVGVEGYVKTRAFTDARIGGTPVQYITGRCEFMSLPFNVDERVLVPRSDTEALVDKILKDFATARPPASPADNSASIIRGIDICTGSGCVAVSLAYYMKDLLIDALDIDAGALDVARSNAELNGVSDRIEFIEEDILTVRPPEGACPAFKQSVGGELSLGEGGKASDAIKLSPYKVRENYYDFIVSNPPYIRTKDIEDLSAEVKNEPKHALDGGNDGLVFYRNIADIAKVMLKNDGGLYFEIGYDQGKDVMDILKGAGFANVYTLKDLTGNDRVVVGIRKQQ